MCRLSSTLDNLIGNWGKDEIILVKCVHPLLAINDVTQNAVKGAKHQADCTGVKIGTLEEMSLNLGTIANQTTMNHR